MKKQYFALFLDDEYYIESCIALIRFINNTNSKTYPHITVRFIYNAISGNEMLQNAEISYLNIISVGMFDNKDTYTVFIQCESEELEELEYKSDYPFSRLHITLYEGKDNNYAYRLLEILEKIHFGFKLSFNPLKKLSKNTVGLKIKNQEFKFKVKEFAKKIGLSLDDIETANSIRKLEMIQQVVHCLNDYIYKYRVELASSNYDDQITFLPVNINECIPYSIRNDEYDFRRKEYSHKKYGLITPPEYAKKMAELAFQYSNADEIHFGDPSVGTGNLYFALLRLLKGHKLELRLKSAIGIEESRNMAKEAAVKYSKRGLKVINSDALLIDYEKLKKRNIIIANPPYMSYKFFKAEYLKVIRDFIKLNQDISVMSTSDIYVYHLLMLDNWLEKDGIAVWLLPSSFLQTNYAISVRRYLIERVTLLNMFINNESFMQFENAKISTTIVVFKKDKPNKLSTVDIVKNNGDGKIEKFKITTDMLIGNISDWRSVFHMTSKVIYKNSSSIKFKEVFDIKRGLATGANSFFVLNRRQAEAYGIPDIALKPILPKARYLDGDTIFSDSNGNPILDKELVVIDCDLPEEKIKANYPQFYNYLQTAKISTNNIPIINRTLVRSRNPWYKQERREPAPFLLTYMGRPKDDGARSVYFLRNKSCAIALNTYLMLYPTSAVQELINQDSKLYDEIFESLKQMERLISLQTRVYSGYLEKIEPNKLKEMEIIGLPKIIQDLFTK